MTTPQFEIKPTEFENVQVIATPELDKDGKITYKTKFFPESLKVTTHDAVINYQLISPTPPEVKFTKVTVSPKHLHQLSHPSISQSGKLVTFSDANTIAEKLQLTFYFIDKDGVEFMVDPDVDNEPPPH